MTLWIEPIITIGLVSRLTSEFDWPVERIGIQSAHPWPFDIVCYAGDLRTETIVCEVKKSIRELKRMMALMRRYSSDTGTLEPDAGPEKNAFCKVAGIRRTWPRTFIAAGSAGEIQAYDIVRTDGSNRFRLVERGSDALRFDGDA